MAARLVVLVVGLEPVDSGKTTLAAGIAGGLARMGFDVGVSKPVGGVDLWRSPWVLREVERLGIVVSGDAVALARAAEPEDPLDEVNPLAVLLAPVDPSRSEWRVTTSDLPLHLRAVAARLTACGGRGKSTLQAVNTEAARRLPGLWARRIEEAASALKPEPVRAGDELMEGLLGPGSLAQADSCLKAILDRREAVVIESQSDVAAPTPLSLTANVVVAVAPGKAAVLSGDRYSRAVSVAGSLGSPHLIRASEAVRLARPRAAFDLPVLEEPGLGYSPGDLAELLDAILDTAGVR
ncbi:hypothetical protein [Stetteria hydrogenophila]